ncbi:hypothetical protein WJX77_009930 [Trebouxia sp. C0004]
MPHPSQHTEIQTALQALHSGRSGALLGHTSEFLGDAKLAPTAEDPGLQKLLVPYLHPLFNAAITSGQFPNPGPLRSSLSSAEAQACQVPSVPVLCGPQGCLRPGLVADDPADAGVPEVGSGTHAWGHSVSVWRLPAVCEHQWHFWSSSCPCAVLKGLDSI